MMPRQPRICVYDSDHPPDNSRRFLAVLCLTQFWGILHYYGLWFLQELGSPPSQPEWADAQLAETIQVGSMLCLSLLLWSWGRTLWRGSGPVWAHVLGILVCSAFTVWGSAIVEMRHADWEHGRRTTVLGFEISRELFRLIRNVTSEGAEGLRWMALAAVFAVSWRQRPWINGRRSRWAIWASAWCLVTALFAVSWWPYGGWLALIAVKSTHRLLPVLYIALPALCGLFFLLSRWSLWVLPLALGSVHLLNIAVGAHWWVSNARWTDPDGIVSGFGLIVVRPVYEVGPWLAIAFWAWRYPARAPADDGTPLPRRHCANCLYNLQGLSSDRCPECGAITGTPKEQHAQATHELLSGA